MRTVLGLSTVFIALSTIGCGPTQVRLPTGVGTPVPDYETTLRTSLEHCAQINSFSAELGLAGHAGSQRLRGRVLAGFAPSALRLEAVAPSGTPAFILVSDGARARLLLARDRRVVEAKPDEILEALVGIAIGPDDLRTLLSGCLKASVAGTAARAYGTDWLVIELRGDGDIYLHRRADGAWRPVAGHFAGMTIEYVEFQRETPGSVRIRSRRASQNDVDLAVTLSQIDVNGDLTAEKLVALNVPTGTLPMTLEELRKQGPFGR